MESIQIGWFLQTWLLSAQVFSTREFSLLAVRRFLPRIAPWFTIVLIPLGFAFDGIHLHFHISIGIMGVLYTTVYVLRSEKWEPIAFATTIFLSLVGMNFWQYGNASRVWICAFLLVCLMVVISVILKRFRSAKGVTFASLISVLTELGFDVAWGNKFDAVVVAAMMAIMSGMYVEFRARHDRLVQETHEAVQYDVLTHALTRRGLASWLQETKARGQNEGIIAFCDLDNFKWINDTWGHEVGDRVLQEFVNRIRNGLRANDAVARFGGDEFQIWIPLQDASVAEQIVDRLHRLATEGEYPVLKKDEGLKIGVSIGWTYGPLNEETANQADYALLSAKKSGKNCIMKSSRCQELIRQNRRNEDPHLFWLTNIALSLWRESHYPFVLTDRDGRILVTNEAYEHLVGRTRDELRGAKPGMNSANKTPMKVYQSMWANLSHGKPWSGCLLNRREDGTEWWEVAELFPVVLSGQIVGYWGMVQELNNARFPHSTNRNNYSWHGEIEWAFQPIVDADSQTPIGYEALARPKWGSEFVGPDTFFRIAERFDFCSQADWDCLESLLKRLLELSWPNGNRLFLNVYAGTLRDTERIRNWLERLYKQHPRIICVFEILEHHVDSIDIHAWNQLQAEFPMIELAQDDFGVGEQDLMRLMTVKPDWIKLDRQWVTMAEQPESKELLYSIADWAASQDIRIIIEGIETLEQSQIYQRLGIQHQQGYFWSRPQKELPQLNYVNP
ncbi:EAL domain-containing protein [Collibacillus ludicampi]|nr:EAL domain-containing protein [Collibacillus ludicampi]